MGLGRNGLIAVGLAATLANCGESAPTEIKRDIRTPAPEQVEPPEKNIPNSSEVGGTALSGCDLGKVRRTLRQRVLDGKPFFIDRSVALDPQAEAQVQDGKRTIIKPGVLACKGTITAYVGLAFALKAKASNDYNPVVFIKPSEGTPPYAVGGVNGTSFDTETELAAVRFDRALYESVQRPGVDPFTGFSVIGDKSELPEQVGTVFRAEDISKMPSAPVVPMPGTGTDA